MKRYLLLQFFLAGIFSTIDGVSQSGCTSAQACNYDPVAVVDDGTCYGVGDFDCNYQIDVIDYLILMQHINCPTTVNDVPTTAIRCDLNVDGLVGVVDLILFIAMYGWIYTP